MSTFVITTSAVSTQFTDALSSQSTSCTSTSSSLMMSSCIHTPTCDRSQIGSLLTHLFATCPLLPLALHLTGSQLGYLLFHYHACCLYLHPYLEELAPWSTQGTTTSATASLVQLHTWEPMCLLSLLPSSLSDITLLHVFGLHVLDSDAYLGKNTQAHWSLLAEGT